MWAEGRARGDTRAGTGDVGLVCLHGVTRAGTGACAELGRSGVWSFDFRACVSFYFLQK